MYTALRTRGGGSAAASQRWLQLRRATALVGNHNHPSSFSVAQRSLSSSPVGWMDPSRNNSVVSLDYVSSHRHPKQYPRHARYFTTGSNRNNDGGKNKPPGSSSGGSATSTSSRRPNFDRDVLQRAARGELDHTKHINKHSSGIPRLMGRSPKPNLRPPQAGPRAGRLALGRAQDRRVTPFFNLQKGGGPEEDEEQEDGAGMMEDDDDANEEENWRLSSALRKASGGVGGGLGRTAAMTSRGAGGSGTPPQQQQPSLDDLFGEDEDSYHAFELMNDDKYYWREEEVEKLVNAEDEFDESFLYDEDGNFVVEYTEEDLEFRPLLERPDFAARARNRLATERGGTGLLGQRGGGGGADNDDDDDDDDDAGGGGDNDPDNWALKKMGVDPEERFFYDNNDIFEICQRDGDFYDPMTPEQQEFYNTTMPLAPHEPGLDGFLQAMNEHPTKYATVTFENPHAGSKREPKPLFFPKTRKHPPLEWVQAHKRFLYVTGLPPLTVNGEPGDMSNAIHRSLLQQTIAKLVVGVQDSSQICVANRRSAFVGFASPRQLASALAAGPTEAYLKKVPMISQYTYEPSSSADADTTATATTDKDSLAEFVKTRPDCIVRLTNIPPGNTSASVARNLFPTGTQVGEVYGGGTLTSNDIHFLTKTSILVRFALPEQAQSAVTSTLVLKRLEEWGTYPVQFLRARRELVHAGFGEISKDDEVRVMGPRLIVDGDMPSRNFHISHAGTILLRNLDAATTMSSSTWQSSLKKDLTQLFQPFCERRRDGNRSIEFVTCQAGRFTGHAYIGFDEPGEAEACINQCKGRLKFGDRTMGMKLVHDRLVPHREAFKPDKRPARTEAELLDDLNNWEKYVDAADIAYLQKHGVSKLVIDEALRGIRRSNPTFAALDAGLRSEALEPSMERGQQYKELVQMYIATLKDCIATPDDVGEMYEALHFPDEPIDMSVFDRWNARLKDIERVRSSSSS